MKKILLIAVLGLSLSACSPDTLFSMLAQSDIEQAAGESIAQSEQSTISFDEIVTEKNERFDESTDLLGLSEDGSYGYGFRNAYSEEEGLVHEVIAILPPLEEEGAFYEGWLVNPTNGRFMSTGPMSLDDNGQSRSLYFAINMDITDYSQVVITKELVRDQTPETHVLEGEF